MRLVCAGDVCTCTDGDALRVSSGKVLILPHSFLPPPKAAQMFSLGQENISTPPASSKGPVKYGELIVLG